MGSHTRTTSETPRAFISARYSGSVVSVGQSRIRKRMCLYSTGERMRLKGICGTEAASGGDVLMINRMQI